MLVTYRMQYAMSVSLGGKYGLATVMCLVLPMRILTSCNSVLFMFVKVMSSLFVCMVV